VTETSGAPALESADRATPDAPFIRIVAGQTPTVAGATSFFAGHRLSGFASWEWDGAELRAATDRFGLYPLFYCHDGEAIALSTSLLTLIPLLRSRDWDLDALGAFLRLGYFIGDETPFRGIRVAPPFLRWREGKLHAPAARPEVKRAIHLPRESVEAEYGRLFSASIRKRLDASRLFVPLSGGRDSRHIFLELLRRGASVEAAITTDSWRATEREAGAELCRRTGVRHVVVPPTYFTLAAALERNRATFLCSDEHFWSLTVRDRLRAERAQTIFDGLAGDVLSQSKNLSPQRLQWMRRGELRAMAGHLVAAEDAFLRQILARDFLEAMPAGRLIDRLADELAAHQGQPNPVGSFFFWNRMRREIALAPFGVLREFAAHTPFLDEELYEFLSALAAEFLLEQPLHDAVLRREFPEHADVPFAKARAGAQPPRPNAADLLDLGRYVAAGSRRVRKAAVLSRLLAALLQAPKRRSIEAVLKWPVYLRQLDDWTAA
jgi:asparagine synthase (glutamine-hydrolysing)